jgi:hypothetical protein
MDFDELLSDNLSSSIHQINHSSDGIFSIGNQLGTDAQQIEVGVIHELPLPQLLSLRGTS